MKLNQGFNVVGKIKGLHTNDAGFTTLGIAQTSLDQYGDERVDVININVSEKLIPKFRNLVADNRGSICIVDVVCQAKLSKAGNAYQSIFIHQNSEVQIIEKVNNSANKAA